MESNPAAGLLLLGVGVMLLLMYVTGRLEWLFSIGTDVAALKAGTAQPALLSPQLQTTPPAPRMT